MAYKSASIVLPKKLIKEIQKDVQGETIYIPKKETAYYQWGERSGTKAFIHKRNAAMKQAFSEEISIEQLAARHHLAVETIKKIVSVKKC
ncbi:CD3324 family protein [Shouchella patagoniensis]|uniref:CD3324 family protein n=1 Tax=Shouchella patagoniensis TaxID=228576 RepID=UPI000994BCDC|nr:CD3324 family protein [Shouchella patagoniensis]